MAGGARGDWLDELYHYSYLEVLQSMLAHNPDQMIGLSDKLGLPQPDMPLKCEAVVVRPLFRHL